jgi:hypothetical protein
LLMRACDSYLTIKIKLYPKSTQMIFFLTFSNRQMAITLQCISNVSALNLLAE